MKFFDHLHTIRRHKRAVRRNCFRLGLYKQGLLHDLSKYSPTEFLLGVKYYQGYQSPHNGERKTKGYSDAWLHHKGRNKHHLEYWCDYDVYGTKDVVGLEMPVRYVAEMFCDRVGACKNYNGEKYTDGDALAYYNRSKEHYLLHPKTRALLEEMLTMLRDCGEEKTFAYIRTEILKKKR